MTPRGFIILTNIYGCKNRVAIHHIVSYGISANDNKIMLIETLRGCFEIMETVEEVDKRIMEAQIAH